MEDKLSARSLQRELTHEHNNHQSGAGSKEGVDSFDPAGSSYICADQEQIEEPRHGN